jgi:3-dehydroquinate synthase
MRGVRYLQVPTTLLAQVDSSVGGKVAVDSPAGKNMLGAFYPPAEVLIDVSVLESLPLRQFRNGMAEVLKYGFIMDRDLLDLSVDDLEAIVRRCVAHKVRIVEEDEFETKGLRSILNYGHTVGHAIEQVTGYSELLHGEAISIGMVIEARLGERLGITRKGTADQVERRLKQAGLPTSWPTRHAVEGLIATMKRDKKAVDGRMRFSLLTEIGRCKLVSDVPEPEVVDLLSGE